LGYLLAGVLIGYVVGVLPGLGAPAAFAFLLPAVASLAPVDGIVLLTATSAVAAGAGDITSILLGVPGEATAAAILADRPAHPPPRRSSRTVTRWPCAERDDTPRAPRSVLR